jgi:hypothetical protein
MTPPGWTVAPHLHRFAPGYHVALDGKPLHFSLLKDDGTVATTEPMAMDTPHIVALREWKAENGDAAYPTAKVRNARGTTETAPPQRDDGDGDGDDDAGDDDGQPDETDEQRTAREEEANRKALDEQRRVETIALKNASFDALVMIAPQKLPPLNVRLPVGVVNGMRAIAQYLMKYDAAERIRKDDEAKAQQRKRDDAALARKAALERNAAHIKAEGDKRDAEAQRRKDEEAKLYANKPKASAARNRSAGKRSKAA